MIILFLILLFWLFPMMIAFVDAVRWWSKKFREDSRSYAGEGEAIMASFAWAVIWPFWLLYRIAKKFG